jgi:hypothetical protein
MTTLSQNYLGIPLQSQKIVPGNTAVGIAASIYRYTEYTLHIDAGTDVIAAGDVIVGASSGAVAIVKSITVESGTWAGDNVVATLRLKSWSGTAFTNDEKLKVGADATCADVDGTTPTEVTTAYQFQGQVARHLMVSVKAQTVVMAIDGSTPDQTALVGHNLAAGVSYIIHDAQEMAQAKFIDAAAGSAGTVIVTAYF